MQSISNTELRRTQWRLDINYQSGPELTHLTDEETRGVETYVVPYMTAVSDTQMAEQALSPQAGTLCRRDILPEQNLPVQLAMVSKEPFLQNASPKINVWQNLIHYPAPPKRHKKLVRKRAHL